MKTRTGVRPERSSRSTLQRVIALFGAGVVLIVRWLVESIGDRTIVSQWPLAPDIFASVVGIGAAVFAVFVSVTPRARKEHVPSMRWGAAATILFSMTYLASRHANGKVLKAWVVGGGLAALPLYFAPIVNGSPRLSSRSPTATWLC